MLWIRVRDKAGRVLALPNQTPHILGQYGLTREQADRQAWAIDTAGRKYAGAAAMNQVWQELGGFWTRLSAAYRWAPVRWIENCVYNWIAAHRQQLSRWWSVTPECQRPGVTCD